MEKKLYRCTCGCGGNNCWNRFCTKDCYKYNTVEIMANNRLWAVCIDDNEAEMLAKYYPVSGWSGGFLPRNEFFLKHEDCPSNKGCGEQILFCTEQDDRIEKYDFTKSHEGKTKIYVKK